MVLVGAELGIRRWMPGSKVCWNTHNYFMGCEVMIKFVFIFIIVE